MPLDSALLAVLRVGGLAVGVVCLWAVWERRYTFGSRLDSTGTAAIALIGIGAALDAPWWGTAEALHSVVGKYYVLKLLADLCYVAGAGLTVKAIYLRLLSDDAITPFLRKRIAPLMIGTSAILVFCFTASAVTSGMSAVHPYLVVPDGPMTVYWLAHFGTRTALGAIAAYGIYHLRRDPRSVFLNISLAALLTATLFGGVLEGYAVITGRIRPALLVSWLLTYTAFAVAAVAGALQWRRRMRLLAGRDGQVR